MKTFFLVSAAILGFSAVGLGAIGSHALGLNETLQKTFSIANQFHFYHIFSLLLTGLLFEKSKWFEIAAWLFFAGIILFSGNLYLYCITESSLFRKFTPLGGISLMLGWLSLALAFWRLRQ